MSKLIYKTKQGLSTYGKPRVYLSFCKADGDGEAATLCDDILGINNCTVFMYEEGLIPEDPETRETEMGQMQLFVLVCTRKYLSDANSSRDDEIFFAFEHGIPILPVIPGGDVVNEFNALCTRLGIESLHCLDRKEFVGNEQGYKEKLREYLDYFLISSMDTAKIKEHFRACIFLSYRKIDREYARRLIRRIHSFQKYYDVAVWYDDYLVPGKSFENEIFDAMDGSDLFMLAVTPNIVALNASGEENYVVRKEYPEALERGKRIIAAELARTDKTALLIKFDNIPKCINAWDGFDLESALSVLDNEASYSTESEHRYYIGLAYLNGINAEIDPNKAVELISSAAGDRFEPAMDYLVKMYRSGIALPRDHGKAIEWQQKLIELARDRLAEDETAENAHALAYRLGQMGNYKRELKDDDGALAVFMRTLEIAEKYADKYHIAALYRDISVACNKTGDIYLERKDYTQAKICFESGWRTAGVLRDEQPDEVSVRDYAISCQKLGQVYRITGEFEKAKEYYSEAYMIAKEVMDREPTTANIRDAYITEAMLGDMAVDTGDYADAEEKYRESLKLREMVERETESDWAKRDISVIWEKFADLYSRMARFRDASDSYEQAVYTANELLKKAALPVYESELSKICTKAGEFHLNTEQYDEAAYYLEAALSIDETMAKKTCLPEDKRDLSVSYNRLAMLYKGMGELQKARVYFEKDYQIAKELAEMLGTFASRRDVELSCNYLGSLCSDLKEYTAAEKYYTEGINMGIALVRETDDPVYWDDLGVLYFNLYRMTYSSTALDQAYHIWNKLAKEYPENGTYAQRLAILENLIQ